MALMDIREARHGDEEGIWKAHTRAITQISAKDYPADVINELVSRQPVDNIEQIDGHQQFVAEIDDTIVGFGALRLNDGEVVVLIVDPDFIRQGIGTQLLAQLEKAAVSAGLQRLVVGSSIYGRPFYQTCGYAGDAMRTVKGRRTGVEFDEYLMEKAL